jgi:hypothetical protein
MQRIAALLTALAPCLVLAQAPESLGPVAERYLGAGTYCETGKWGMRDLPAQGYTEVSFSRCAHSDGRFKLTEFADRPQKLIIWADGKKHYRYSESARVYQEYPVDQPYINSPYGARGEVYPAFLSGMFPWRASGPSDATGSAPRLEAFRASSALSTPQHTVYERHADERRGTGERVWVLNRDRSIVRWEGLQGGEVHRFVEIASQKINPALDDEDFSHAVPLSVRYSLQNSPRVFITGLFAASALAGMLFWLWLFARAANVEDITGKRRKLWRFQLWTFGAAAAALAGLAVLTSIGRDTGHPPAIVLVFVLAIWCAVIFGLVALFTLTSYPVQWLFERREAREPR